VIPKIVGPPFATIIASNLGRSRGRANQGGRTAAGCFRQKTVARTGILLGHVTRDRNFRIFEPRAQIGLRTPDRLEKGVASSHPGLVVVAPDGGSFFRPFADAVLREEISTRISPDISSGMPVVPTERKPTLSRGNTQGRRRL
jgi:hypothetical protein